MERQKKFMKEKYPNHEIITDIGSGLNFKQKGLLKVLEQGLRGEIEEVLCTHRDRLSRFGYRLIQWIMEIGGGRVVVLEEDKSSAQQKLTEDLMSIIHVFSCKLHGMRRYSSKKKQENKILSNLPKVFTHWHFVL
ncbi:IS607 family transposase [Candidatus Uabimicrobium sp. HlEnr_7]|uniref:IS607 family transposase n=1 Tax=Candidatus Uabimicrobium helgolandensis TaxID=3095367 RepID=UPI00355650C8